MADHSPTPDPFLLLPDPWLAGNAVGSRRELREAQVEIQRVLRQHGVAYSPSVHASLWSRLRAVLTR